MLLDLLMGISLCFSRNQNASLSCLPLVQRTLRFGDEIAGHMGNQTSLLPWVQEHGKKPTSYCTRVAPFRKVGGPPPVGLCSGHAMRDCIGLNSVPQFLSIGDLRM